MPLHRIYHVAGVFTDEQKQGLAQAITYIYVNGVGLPAFYVVVLFIPIDKNSLLIGGGKTEKFIRIIIQQHIARPFVDPKRQKHFMETYEAAIAPRIKERGFDWEVSIEVVDRELWRENGPIPPHARDNTEAEKEWKRLNKAVPYE